MAAHQLRAGDTLAVGGPRNHFRMRPTDNVQLIAGGIGITPLLPMIDAAEQAAADWHLLYLGRTRAGMAYGDDLVQRHPNRVRLWPSNELGRHDLEEVWSQVPPSGVVYACGPESLLTDLETSARRHEAENQLVIERFAPRPVQPGPSRAFEVRLARRGTTIAVAEDESLLDALNRAGAGILSTCREGTCGTCEVTVLEGVPEHRDSVLDLEERLNNLTMMSCVSRCVGPRLALDL